MELLQIIKARSKARPVLLSHHQHRIRLFHSGVSGIALIISLTVVFGVRESPMGFDDTLPFRIRNNFGVYFSLPKMPGSVFFFGAFLILFCLKRPFARCSVKAWVGTCVCAPCTKTRGSSTRRSHRLRHA